MLDPCYYEELSRQMKKAAADQLSVWPLASANFRALKNCASKEIELGSFKARVLNLPQRAISTLARTDAGSLAARPCFLCAANRPAQQAVTPFEGAKGKKYNIQINPYPIVQEHFVVPAVEHVPQSIWHRYVDMLRLAKRRPGFTILYNGPKCGASAPDHFHFQAVPSEILPLENAVRTGGGLRLLTNVSDACLYLYDTFIPGVFVIRGRTSKSMNRMFYRFLDCCDILPGDTEPRFNLFTFRQDGGYCSVIVLRTGHRSFHYTDPDPRVHLTMSPGCVDMAGLFVTIDRGDFEKLDSALLGSLAAEVAVPESVQEKIVDRLTRTQRKVSVRLQRCEKLRFSVFTDGAGIREAYVREGRIDYGGQLCDELFFDAKNPSTMLSEASFAIEDEACGRRCYAGALRIGVEDGMLAVTNVIGIEDLVFSILSFAAPELGYGQLCQQAVSLRKQLSEGSRPASYKGLNSTFPSELKHVIDTTWNILA